MANEIFTRLQLKYDTLANWNAVKDTFKPLAGEVCIAKIEVNDPANKLLDPVMIKVGDGTSTWGQLDWISAKAADVYAWAKKSGIDVEVIDVEGNPEGDEHVEYPIVNFAWDSANNKLVATKGAIDTDAIEVAGNGSGYAGGNLTDWMSYVLNLMWRYSYDSEQAHNNLFDDITKEGSEYKRDGSQVVVFYRDYEAGGAYNAYTAEAVDIAITHDQVTDFDTEVKSIAADEINRLINAADPEGGKTIQDIENLVKYVDENAGEIAGLITGVGTAKSDAASAVATAGAANTTAGQALEKANKALEGATGAAKSAAEAEAARAAAVVAQGKAEAAQAGAEAAQVKAEGAQTAAETAQRAAADSAAAAASSAGDAARDAGVATTKAGEAAQSALEAGNAKAEALLAQDAAEKAQSAAEVAKAGAESAQAAANTSASNAATSEENAGKAKEDAEAAQGKAEAAQLAAEAAQAAAEDANTSATAIANEAKGIADAAKEASDAATEVVAGLHAIATSGSIYDVAEGSYVSKGTDTGVRYLVFNCGTASTVI